MNFPKKKDSLLNYFFQILSKSELNLVFKQPEITASNGIEWNSTVGSTSADVKGLPSMLTNGTDQYASFDFVGKAFIIPINPDSTDESLINFSTGETVEIASGIYTLTGFSDATKVEIVKGDYTYICVSNADTITATMEIGRISTTYGTFNWFPPMSFTNEKTASDWAWLVANFHKPTATIKAQYADLVGHWSMLTAGYFINMANAIGVEKVVNGNCELAIPSITNPIAGYGGTIGLSTEQQHSLLKSCKYTGTENVSYTRIALNVGGLSASTNYFISVWVYIPSSNMILTNIGLWSKDSNDTFFESEYISTTDTWTQILFMVDDINMASSFNLAVRANRDAATTESFYIDDLSIKEISADTNYGCTVEYGDAGFPVPMTNFNITEINSTDYVLPDVGGLLDYFGNAITYKGVLNFDGSHNYALFTTSDTINSIAMKYGGDVLIKNGATYYVNGVVASPTVFPYYEDGNDKILGKTDATTYVEGAYDKLILGDTLTASEINLLSKLL